MPHSRKHHKRRKFIVDWRLQFAITAQLLGVLAGVGLLYVIGVFVLPHARGVDEQLTGEEFRTLILKANAIYFTLGAAILGVIALLLTHRIAGPALVLQRAIEGMKRGLYHQRLTLRSRDYLKPLAAELKELCDLLAAKREESQESLADLEACLKLGDLDAARELVKRLKGEPSREHAGSPSP